jgi:hypothetical protein
VKKTGNSCQNQEYTGVNLRVVPELLGRRKNTENRYQYS